MRKSKKPKDKTIKMSKHFLTEANTGKNVRLEMFLTESNRVLQICINHLWDNGIEWKTKEGNVKICCPDKGYYDVPQFISTVGLNIKTDISGRALKCISTQACGIVKSAVEKTKSRLYITQQLEDKQNKTEKEIKSLIRLKNKVQKVKPKKPIVKDTAIELNSLCAQLIRDVGIFDFLELKSLGKNFGKIILPIRHHKHSRKLEQKGNFMNSFLVGKKNINLRWEIKLPPLKKKGKIVGGDTGKNTILTLSNDETTDLHLHPHGHTLDSIMRTMSRKKKGSKGFKRSQDLRTNFINWSVRQLNLNNIKQINLEEVKNIFYKNKTSRFMSAWTNAEIVSALINNCEELGVQVKLQSSVYRSQRCSQCGLVLKANRKEKVYECKGCDFTMDSDLNGARNHAVALPSIPYALRRLNLNREGFYWKSKGFFNLDGSEITVPDTSKRKFKS